VNSAYHRRVAFPSALGNSTTRQLRDLAPALIIPLGSTEQHGPHLPLDTDTRIATAVACAVAERLTGDWLVAPAIGYGASGEHEGFPGTVSIGTEALHHLLVEFARSASGWASRMVFVNGHGGNVQAVAGATTQLRDEGRDVAWCPCEVGGADAHAGHTETSVLLHISPEDVWVDEVVPGNVTSLGELMPALRRGGVAAVSPVGVLGDPTTASAAEGARIFAEMVETGTRRMTAWLPNGGGMLQ
jgi:mycofactocin precursor peptide peptidase